MITALFEEMTFDQLFRYSEPKRIKRAETVRGPPLEINGNSDNVYHVFNFKSFPSTTGLRHHGYVKFKKPQLGNSRKRLQHIPCEVDCTCPDFRYRWPWAEKQKGAARVGAQSMNQCINRKPIHTNPGVIPGLCKHILACRDYIYGMLAKFPGKEPDTGEKLAQLVKYAEKRWSNFDTLMARAKDGEKWYDAVKAAVNQGQGGNIDLIYDIYQRKGGKFLGIPAGVPKRGAPKLGERPPPGEDEEPPELPEPEPPPPPQGPVLPAAGRPTSKAKKPVPTTATPAKPKTFLKQTFGAPKPKLAIGQKTAKLKAAPPIPAPKAKPVPKPAAPIKRAFLKNNLSIGRKSGKPAGAVTPPGKRGPVKRPQRPESVENFLATCVSRLVNGSSDGANNIESMIALNEALKIIEEIEHDEVEAPSAIAGEMAVDAPPPSEPPVSDDAIGADTEGNVVLQVLSDIKDLLAQLVGPPEGEEEFGPEGEMPPGAEGELGPEGEMPPGAEGEEEDHIPVDAIPEPDEDEEGEEEEEEGRPPRPRRNPEGEGE